MSNLLGQLQKQSFTELSILVSENMYLLCTEKITIQETHLKLKLPPSSLYYDINLISIHPGTSSRNKFSSWIFAKLPF